MVNIDTEMRAHIREKPLEGSRGLYDTLQLNLYMAESARARAERARLDHLEALQIAVNLEAEAAFILSLIEEREPSGRATHRGLGDVSCE